MQITSEGDDDANAMNGMGEVPQRLKTLHNLVIQYAAQVWYGVVL